MEICSCFSELFNSLQTSVVRCHIWEHIHLKHDLNHGTWEEFSCCIFTVTSGRIFPSLSLCRVVKITTSFMNSLFCHGNLLLIFPHVCSEDRFPSWFHFFLGLFPFYVTQWLFSPIFKSAVVLSGSSCSFQRCHLSADECRYCFLPSISQISALIQSESGGKRSEGSLSPDCSFIICCVSGSSDSCILLNKYLPVDISLCGRVHWRPAGSEWTQVRVITSTFVCIRMKRFPLKIKRINECIMF